MPVNRNSFLADQRKAIIVIAILVRRLGGRITIEQHDIDNIAYGRLMEEGHGDGSFDLFNDERTQQ